MALTHCNVDHLDEWKIDGRLKLTPGREFTVQGIRGRLRFSRAVKPHDGTPAWVEGFDRDGRWRSIRTERVRTVHTKTKTTPPPGIPPRKRRKR
ncbi:MAG: hypothetical protein GY926_23705 [bacterium]|nr:hypothetical protein [bacterium]